MEGYDYTGRIVAPSVVEFCCAQPQGHRVVRIYLDTFNPRFEAFNETSRRRTPATLFLKELLALIERARQIVDPMSFEDDFTDPLET